MTTNPFFEALNNLHGQKIRRETPDFDIHMKDQDVPMFHVVQELIDGINIFIKGFYGDFHCSTNRSVSPSLGFMYDIVLSHREKRKIIMVVSIHPSRRFAIHKNWNHDLGYEMEILGHGEKELTARLSEVCQEENIGSIFDAILKFVGKE